jgi:hypothetical protein
VQEKTGWDLRVSPELARARPPAEAELATLRALRASGPASPAVGART